MFKCPICREESEIDHHVNGKKKLTCGKKECKIVWNHSKIYRSLKANFTCPYCNKTKFILIEEDRKYCTDSDCKRKHDSRNKVLTLDEMPRADLEKAFPVFYGLVRIRRPERERKCLKCKLIFSGMSGFRTCDNCRKLNSRYGRMANV